MNADILHSPLIAQNLETNHSFYLTLIREAMASGVAVPETVLEAMRQGRPLMAYNAGIIGGCDISFFKEYTREAFGLLAAAASRGGGTDLSRMNAIYEQVLFYCLAMRRKAAVTCYVKEEISDMTYAGYANFSEVPFNNRFIHLMGAFKKNHEVCYMLARRLRLSHPAWYYRIIRELRKSGVALFLSYYDGASDDWAAIYQQEKAQYRRIDSAFSTGEGLRRARFRVNSLLAPAGQAAYVLPFSYTLSHNEIKCDELDEVLISILRKPCPFDELLAAAGEYFEGSDLEGERESFVRLILLKLKRGCDSGLFEVVM